MNDIERQELLAEVVSLYNRTANKLIHMNA